jgi:uncharacterized protein YdeI (YjbR/CyaY-like superfamily)
MEPVFFATPHDFRRWLHEHHAREKELLVGFHKKGSGRPSITWPESVDQALCYGWIDGVRHSIDGDRYSIRFTPRKPTSNWSAVNIRRVGELTEQGLMQPAGLHAFAARREERSGVYSFEQKTVELSAEHEAAFRARPQAWSWFQSCPPGYRRQASWWVMQAKRDETQRKRLATLIEDSEAGRRIAPLRRSSASE